MFKTQNCPLSYALSYGSFFVDIELSKKIIFTVGIFICHCAERCINDKVSDIVVQIITILNVIPQAVFVIGNCCVLSCFAYKSARAVVGIVILIVVEIVFFPDYTSASVCVPGESFCTKGDFTMAKPPFSVN